MGCGGGDLNKSKPKLGYIGLGLMGGPMAGRLADAGYKLTVWNRSRHKLEPFLARGAVEAVSPSEVAAAADVVLMCLTDAKAVESVVFGENGVAEGGAPGKLLADFSSMRPDTTKTLSARLEEACGMKWIDVPVSGGVKGAEEGTLAIFAGGDAADVERVQAVATHFSQRVTHMGPSGAGQMTKLCNQVIVGSCIATIAEAVSLAEKTGVDTKLLTEALKGGWADSQPFQILAPRFATRQMEPVLGEVHTMLKDLDTAVEFGMNNVVPLPMTGLTAETLRRVVADGFGDDDIGAIMTLFDKKEE
jgi:3-hydroxyisobutyrate dehydrogenase